jgi:hypothetical protein
MKSFDLADDTFIKAATDDSRRPDLIEKTVHRRTRLFWCAIVVSVCAFFDVHNSGTDGVLAAQFAIVAMMWWQVFKCESDLRLLKLVDKLKK